MPAPKFLALLPKPLLFALYGAVGGFLGALVFAEPLYHILTPPKSQPPVPEAQVAVAASPVVEVFVEGRNNFPVQIARDGFDGPVTIRVEGLPAGVAAEPVTIAAGKTDGEVVVVAARTAQVIDAKPAKVVVEGGPEGKKATAEAPISFKVTDPPRASADVVFVLDISPSMQWAIDDLKNGIGKFAESLGKARIDFRLGLVTFQNFNNAGPKVEVIQFKGGSFTGDSDVFRSEVSKLKVAIGSGGGNIPQSSLEGINEACKLSFRKDATKMLLLITGQAPKVVGDPAKAVEKTANQVRAASIDAVHTVVHRLDEDVYKPLTKAGLDKGGGKFFNLSDVVRGDDGFDTVLTTFGGVVTTAAIAKNPDSKPRVAEKSKEEPKVVKSLQSSEQTAAGSEGRIILRSGVWTGAIAALVCLMLLGGQHHYLRGSLPAAGGVILGLVGGLAVGVVGGAAGQGLYLIAKGGPAVGMIFQVLGWALLGGLAGVGLSLFIPNMKWTHGLAGGAIGGAVGCACYLAVTRLLRAPDAEPSMAADILGRLAGGLALGFCIGLMVAVVESAFRRAWLEVKYGERERITVTLGPEPVKVGSDAKACTVWARGAPPVALRFFVRDGAVICDDAVVGRETAVGDGFAKEVGTLTVTVRTGSGAAAPPAPPPRPKKQPAKQAAPLSLDEDDGFDLPMPVTANLPPAQAVPPPVPPRPMSPKPPAPVASPTASKPATPPAPPARPPVPSAAAKPPVPTAPKPVVPPVVPAIKSTAKNPDACPSCGRVIPGKPGQRYCMMCDQTF